MYVFMYVCMYVCMYVNSFDSKGVGCDILALL